MSPRSARRSPDLRLESDGELMRWVDRSRSVATEQGETLGQPGLWRRVRRGEGVFRTFECPAPATLVRDGDAEDLRTEIQAWASATWHGRVSPGWTPPPADEIAEWLAPERLTVRAGAYVAKGSLEHAAGHLRIRFPDVVRLPSDLPEGRRAWLGELCLDTQSRWQLVRFGVSGERVQAEVDLSGVPPALARPLFARAVEALAFTVGWALPALAVVSDASVESRTLDRGPWWLQEDLKRPGPEVPARSPAFAGARATTARAERRLAHSIEE